MIAQTASVNCDAVHTRKIFYPSCLAILPPPSKPHVGDQAVLDPVRRLNGSRHGRSRQAKISHPTLRDFIASSSTVGPRVLRPSLAIAKLGHFARIRRYVQK